MLASLSSMQFELRQAPIWESLTIFNSDAKML